MSLCPEITPGSAEYNAQPGYTPGLQPSSLIREDNILTLAFGGIIYSPGSAGTMQEIFQDAVQNHYLSYGIASPMIFLGTQFWNYDMPIYPLLKHLVKKGKYKNLLLSITDSNEEIIQTLIDFRNSNPNE